MERCEGARWETGKALLPPCMACPLRSYAPASPATTFIAPPIKRIDGEWVCEKRKD